MRLPVLPATLLLLAACSPPAEPPPALSFSVDGGTYVWSVANGAKGGLILGRETSGGNSRPALIITCDNLRTGGLQARLFKAEPAPTALELTAGETVMAVPARPRLVGDQAALEGEGPLPPDWAATLGAARMLKLRYGDQGIEVQGPGPERAAAFGRYCRHLDAREG